MGQPGARAHRTSWRLPLAQAEQGRRTARFADDGGGGAGRAGAGGGALCDAMLQSRQQARPAVAAWAARLCKPRAFQTLRFPNPKNRHRVARNCGQDTFWFMSLQVQYMSRD